MTEFERELLNLIREAMRQKDEPVQRRIIELEKNLHERIDKVFEINKNLLKQIEDQSRQYIANCKPG